MATPKNIITKIILILLFIILFIPLYWMFTGSLQDIHGVMVMPPRFIPHNPNLDNYRYLLKNNAIMWGKNTTIVVLGTVITSVIISIATGYAFATYKFKLKKALWMVLLSQMMIPRISLLIPLYIVMKNLHLSGKLLAVILPVALTPMGIYLARNYFESIPKSIIESARIDGATEIQILRLIVIPISKPIISALSLFAGIGALQDYIWQSLVLQKVELQTLLVGLMRMAMESGGGELNINPVGRSFAVGILLLLPLLIIFLIANKYFTESLGGAVKE